MRWPWSWSRTVSLPTPDASWILLGRWVSIPIDSRARRLERNPGTLEPWNPGTPELRNDASSCIIMIHHDPSSIVIITGHVVRESFIFEAHIVLCWVLLFMNCQPRIESVPSSQKYHSVVFVRMEVKAGRKWQKAYLTLLSWRMCGDQFMSLHNWENVERCWAMLDPITQKQFPKSISPLEQTGLAAYSYMSLQIRMSWPVV